MSDLTNRTLLVDLYVKLMAKRDEAAGFADEQADFSEGPPGPIEQEYRAMARAFAEAAEIVKDVEGACNLAVEIDKSPDAGSANTPLPKSDGSSARPVFGTRG